MMRYIVIGAGAIGGAVAARLSEARPEHPPVVVARGANADAIEAHGLVLRTPEGVVVAHPIVARTAAWLELRPDDVLLVAVKTPQVPAVLDEWAARPVAGGGTAGERLPILLATNGVEAERMALRLFRRVVGVCVMLPATHLDPGEVVSRLAPTTGVFVIGTHPPRLPDADDQRMLDEVARDLTTARIRTHVVDDVRRWKYDKLLRNLANVVQALVGDDDPEGADRIADRLRREATRVLDAAAIGRASDAEDREMRGDVFAPREVPGAAAPSGNSTWQSLRRGTGSVETDYLNGEIVLIAREHGTDAPLNAVVQARATAAAASGGAGAMTVAELADLLDAAG